MSSNHTSGSKHPAGTTPSWLTDQGSTAWAVGRPGAPRRTSASPDWAAVPDPADVPEPADTTRGAEMASSAETVRPTDTAAKAARPAEPVAAPAPAARPDPDPDPATQVRPGAPAGSGSPSLHQPRPAWDGGDSVLSNVVRVRKSPPSQGWRAFVYRASGGRWNPGLSQGEERLRDQLQKIRTPLPGPHSVVVGSIKGGIGKTTVSSLLGLALAEHRGDRVIAIDANPDAGTLGDRLVGEQAASKTTMRDLLHNIDRVRSSTQLAGYTHLAGRLQVLTSEQEPELSEMFSAADYETVLRLVARFYEAIITDSGTGVVHSAMQGSLAHADSLVIVGAPTQDGASRASRTLQWLATHGYAELAADAVVVLSYDRHSPFVDEAIIHEHFASRARAVIELPSDRHLATGGLIDLGALSAATRDAALELAATVADGFHSPRSRGLSVHGFRSEPGR